MTKRDAWGLAVVAVALGAMLAYRATYLEPTAWGEACAVARPPLACLPRAALGWSQYWQVWGAAALACGIWAVVGAGFAVRVAAVALGAVAVANYNASWGMLGLVLGAWAWCDAPGATKRDVSGAAKFGDAAGIPCEAAGRAAAKDMT
ncbi:MAG: hypothetical protein JWP04_3874 [Belnapia sp.]|nr:hypothetical protein [Belnapia sp.]